MALIDRVRAYLRGIEQGDLQAILACYAPDAVQLEWPNRLKDKGDRRGLDQLATDFQRGQGLLSSQSYEITNYAEAPDYVMVELVWKGRLAVPLGTLPAGAEMVAHSAIGFNFSGDRIVAQRNYDCFDAF